MEIERLSILNKDLIEKEKKSDLLINIGNSFVNEEDNKEGEFSRSAQLDSTSDLESEKK